MKSLIEMAREVIESPLVLAKFFKKPRCKPWDLVKGRRFRCCYGLGVHTKFCPNIPIQWEDIQFGQLTADSISKEV